MGEASQRKGKVKSIVRLRIHSDGEGVRTVVFLYGCPLTCRWCCNPETRVGEKYREVTARQLWDLVKRDLIYFRETGGGITFSGGEPLLQYAFIREFARLTEGLFPICMETSLYAPRQAVEALVPYVQCWYVDFKAPDGQTHRHFTGVEQSPILENMAFLARRIPAERLVVTCPLIPGFTATDGYVDSLINLMGKLGLNQAQLHPHRKRCEGKYAPLGLAPPEIPSLSKEELERLRRRLESSGIRTEGVSPVLGRDKCPLLKGIRREIAARHGIGVEIPDCPHQGPCPGTCPRCEWELKQINGELSRQGLFPEV